MIHTNTFYKPKNEYGELLAARKYVDIEISDNINALKEETNKKIDDLTANFEEKNADVTDSITELQNKQYLTFTPIFNQPIEEYIASLHSLDNFDPVAFKIKIGQTIYLRETGAGEAGEYEEYICINPYDYIPEAQNYGALVFNRLGAVEAIVASNRRHGSVRLLDSIYNVENWEDFRHEEKGTSPVSYAPSEGVAVAPYALKDFKDADNALKDKDIELEGAITETNLKVEEIDGRTSDNEAKIERIIDELCGIKEDNNAEITDSRIDKNEADISTNKELIDELRKVIGLGPHGCNSSCASCNCGHECKFDTEEDCCIICKVNNLDDAVNINAESLVNLDTAHNETVERLNFAEDNINTLNTTVGSPRDSHNPDTLCGKITFLQEKDIELDDKISDIDKRVTANENNIGVKDSDIKTTDNIWGNIRQIESDIVDANTEINNINTTIGNPDNNSDAQTLFGRIKKNSELIDAASNNILSNTTNIGNWDTDKGTISSVITETIESIENNTNTIGQWDTVNNGTIANVLKDVQSSLGTNPHNAGEGKTAWSEIDKLFNEKADGSKVTAEIQSVTKQIEEAEDRITNIINKEIGDKTSSDTDDTLWGSTKVNGEKIKNLELSLGNKEYGDPSDSAWANINKLQSDLNTLNTEVNEKITQTIEPFESRIETLEDFNKVRNIVITTEIPAGEGEFLELKYSDILENIIPNGNWSNYEIIVNGVKIEDVDNISGEIYTISAWPSITYIKNKANDSNGGQFNKIRFDFADNDAISHKTYISMTIYDMTQHENYIHL